MNYRTRSGFRIKWQVPFISYLNEVPAPVRYKLKASSSSKVFVPLKGRFAYSHSFYFFYIYMFYYSHQKIISSTSTFFVCLCGYCVLIFLCYWESIN